MTRRKRALGICKCVLGVYQGIVVSLRCEYCIVSDGKGCTLRLSRRGMLAIPVSGHGHTKGTHTIPQSRRQDDAS